MNIKRLIYAAWLLCLLGVVSVANASLVTVEIGTFFNEAYGQSSEGNQLIAISYDGVAGDPTLIGLGIYLGANAELDNTNVNGDLDGSGSIDNEMAIFDWDTTALSGVSLPYYNDYVGDLDDQIVAGPWQSFYIGFTETDFPVATPLGFDVGESIVLQADFDPADGTGFMNPQVRDDNGDGIIDYNDYMGASVAAFFSDGSMGTSDFLSFYETSPEPGSAEPGCDVTLVWCAFASIGDITPPDDCPPGTTGTPPDDCVPIVEDCPAGTTGTPPNCVMDVVDDCPAGTTGTFPNCVPDVVAVPEPGTIALMGLGLIGLGFARRRQDKGRRKQAT